jgi:hypothetical protein
MEQTAVIPAWVVPPPAQIADCYRLAYAAAIQTGGHRDQAVAATLGWVTGLQGTPLTQQAVEATAETALAEMMIADGHDPLRRAVTDNRGWKAGVAVTLSWLLGLCDTPPVQIPRRLDDGTTPTVAQLYTELMHGKTGMPEQRIAARRQAEKDAALHRRLAERADSVH